jgi:hypothetical protein
MTQLMKDIHVEDVLVGEVSLVDKAANRRKFLLLKNLGDDPVEKIIKLALDTELDNEGAVTEKLEGVSEDSQNAVIAALRILQAHKEEVSTDLMKSLAPDFGIEIPEVEPKKTEEEPKKTVDMDKLPEGLREHFAGIQKANEGLQERLEKAEIRADNLERTNRLAEYVTKAEELGLPGVEADTMGEDLLTIDEKAPETFKRLVGVLESTSKVLRDSKLFKSVGKTGTPDGDGSAWDKMTKLARERVSNSDGGISLAKALDEVLRENEELAAQYHKENR